MSLEAGSTVVIEEEEGCRFETLAAGRTPMRIRGPPNIEINIEDTSNGCSDDETESTATGEFDGRCSPVLFKNEDGI